MAFFTADSYASKVVRSPSIDPVVNPQPVKAGTFVISYDMKSMGLVTVAGHLGGDNFEVQYTAGSNLVVIPNDILVFTGLKLFSPQFPAGVAITSKTATYRTYTIASNATVTRKEFSNFCYIRTAPFQDFSNYNNRTTPAGADLNLIRNEGSYYVPTATSNLPVSGMGYFVDIVQSGSSIMQIARANHVDQKLYHRRSTDAGVTWTAWLEVLTTHALTWVNGTLQNGFTTYLGSSSNTLQFARQGNIGWMRGVVAPPATYGDSYTTCTIPTEFTPVETQYFVAGGHGAGASTYPANRFRISSSGIVALAHNFAVPGWSLNATYYLK